jgi:hypothetical protein
MPFRYFQELCSLLGVDQQSLIFGRLLATEQGVLGSMKSGLLLRIEVGGRKCRLLLERRPKGFCQGLGSIVPKSEGQWRYLLERRPQEFCQSLGPYFSPD